MEAITVMEMSFSGLSVRQEGSQGPCKLGPAATQPRSIAAEQVCESTIGRSLIFLH